MKSASSSLPFGAFATPGAGFGYFTTAERYRHLARGVLDAFHRGGLVLVTADPPVCLPMLTEALRKATPRPVIEICCGPALDCQKFLTPNGGKTDWPAPGAAEGERAGLSAQSNAIYVFGDADRLSDAQIETILDAAHAEPPGAPALDAGVLVAPSSFPARLKKPVAVRLEDRLAAHLSLQQLERDEVEAFIRYQLPPGSEGNFLSAQRIALIAIGSGGDPAVVNRLALRALDEQPITSSSGGLLTRLQQGRRPGARTPTRAESEADRRPGIGEETTAAPGKRRRSYAGSLGLSVGAIVCIGILALIFGALGWKDFGAFLHDRLLGEGPAQVALPVISPNPMDTSPSAVTAVPTAPAVITPAPAPPASEPPRAAPSSLPAPAPSPAVPAVPRLSGEEIAALVARGDALLGAGDIVSARLFFQRAADAGDSGAAMRMALSFDAAFLDRAGFRGVRGDPEQAAIWYRQARDLNRQKTEPGAAPAKEPAPQPR